MCREQWRGTAAHRLSKCRALNFNQAFSKTDFLCRTLFFWILYKSGLIFSLVLCSLQFYLTFSVLTALHLFLSFPWPVHLDPGDAILPVACVSTVSSILGIISDVTNNYSTQMVPKRKYLRYFDKSQWFEL